MIKSQGDALWKDTDAVTHIVGRHDRTYEFVAVHADCGVVIGKTLGPSDGFYQGNTEGSVTCLLCLHASNFGTYAPR